MLIVSDVCESAFGKGEVHSSLLTDRRLHADPAARLKLVEHRKESAERPQQDRGRNHRKIDRQERADATFATRRQAACDGTHREDDIDGRPCR